MKNFSDFLAENNVSLNEMTIEMMVDKCIKEGKSKDGALEYCKVSGFPVQVKDILKRLPRSIFESMIECEITFESLMEDYEGDFIQMIDDYLSEDYYEDDEDDEDDDEDGKKKKDGEGKEPDKDGEGKESDKDDDIKKK
jgi:hypothetical protein